MSSAVRDFSASRQVQTLREGDRPSRIVSLSGSHSISELQTERSQTTAVVVSYEDCFVHEPSATRSLTARREDEIQRSVYFVCGVTMQGFGGAPSLRSCRARGHVTGTARFVAPMIPRMRYIHFRIQPWWCCLTCIPPASRICALPTKYTLRQRCRSRVL